jgi:hypothetical protein
MNKTMDRQIIITLAALTLAFTGLAQANMKRIEEAYELDLTQVMLPAHTADRVTLKQCADCYTVQLSVNARTSYHVGMRSAAVTLLELTATAAGVRDRENTPIYVMYEPESLVVTRIILDTASR